MALRPGLSRLAASLQRVSVCTRPVAREYFPDVPERVDITDPSGKLAGEC